MENQKLWKNSLVHKKNYTAGVLKISKNPRVQIFHTQCRTFARGDFLIPSTQGEYNFFLRAYMGRIWCLKWHFYIIEIWVSGILVFLALDLDSPLHLLYCSPILMSHIAHSIFVQFCSQMRPWSWNVSYTFL